MYEVSTTGRVRSVDRVVPIGTKANGRKGFQRWKGKELAQTQTPKGYQKVELSQPGHRALHVYVHRLVMLAFVGPCPEGLEVCHNNGKRTDNRLNNLRYDTRSSNALDRHAHGTFNPRRGEDAHNSKLTEEAVRWIRASIGSLSYREMARRLGVTHRTVIETAQRKRWAHVN